MITRRNIRYFTVSLILASSLLFSAGCSLLTGFGPTPSPASPVGAKPSPILETWSPPATSQAPLLPSIADVVAKVKPSVVTINTETVTSDFFNTPSLQEGAGSGWIIDKSGIIVTNNHVVEGAQNITVVLDDGRTFPVDVKNVATDALADLAVLKINAENIMAVAVGNSSNLRIGDWVVAIGNSLGMGTSATKGIVSSLGVNLEVSAGQTLNDLIQTDAAINPGNSGGPLVNLAGEVIGINSAKIARVGVEGTGFAISIKEALPIIQQLIKTGYVVRPWLGVGLYPVDQYAVYRYNLAVDTGALVISVAAGSPAEKAGLKAGDVIAKFAGKEIADVNELLKGIHSAQVGQDVEIIFWRGKDQNSAHAILVKSPVSS